MESLKVFLLLTLLICSSANGQRTGSVPPVDLEATEVDTPGYSMKESMEEIAKSIYARDRFCTKEKTYLLTPDFLNLTRVLLTIPLDYPYSVACCDSESAMGSLYSDYFHCVVDEKTKKNIQRFISKEEESIRILRTYGLTTKESKAITDFYNKLYKHLQ